MPKILIRLLLCIVCIQGLWILDAYSGIPTISAGQYCKNPAQSEEQILKGLALRPQEFFDPMCEKLFEYLQIHQSDAVHLVFSSYNLHAPASMFGHTLLKFSKSVGSSDLLDMAINYGAKVTTNNPFIYAWKGLWGGFKGEFSSLPYYYKIREYNDYESRDLWSYELILNNHEKQMLLFFLWEYGQKDLDYYYFDENCSYMLLKLIHLSSPEKKILDNFFATFVIPIDTVKALDKVGMIKSTNMRPSMRWKANTIYEQLSDQEKSIALDLLGASEYDKDKMFAQYSDLSLSSQANILESMIASYDYIYAQDILYETGEHYQRKKALLEIRSKNPTIGTTFNLTTNPNSSPLNGHETKRLGFGFSTATNRRYSLLSFRGAIHDELDPPLGWPREMSVEMVNLVIAYDWQTSHFPLRFQNIDIIRIETKNPITPLKWEKTIKMKVGFSNQVNRDGNQYFVPDLLFGGGITLPMNSQWIWTNTFDTQINYGHRFERYPVRLGFGGHSSMRYWFNDKIVTLFKYEYWRYLYTKLPKASLELETRVHLYKDFSLGLGANHQFFKHPLKDSITVMMYYFF